jgi:hypothetical protein
MQYFAVRAAHRRQPGPIAGEKPRNRGIDLAFFVALVGDHLHDRVGLID